MKVVEVLFNTPAESFLRRHADSLTASGLDVEMVARHQLAEYSSSASVSEPGRSEAVLLYPNFEHIGWAGKIWSLRWLLYSPRAWVPQSRLRRSVQLAFFARLKPDVIHFHTATLAVLMAWIPRELGIPYTLSLRGSDVQVSPPAQQGDEAKNGNGH